MNESRTIKELLQVLHDHVEKYGLTKAGLCSTVTFLFWGAKCVTVDELWDLRFYINGNRPKWYSSTNAFIARDSAFYWPEGKVAPRLKWLKKHIKLNS